MREDFDMLAFLLGLPSGILVASIAIYINYRIGKKQRRFDERYHRIQADAKSFAWAVTILALIIAWGIVIVVEGPGLAFFIISIIYVISMLAYLIGGILAERKN